MVRHGKAEPGAVSDEARRLTSRGVADAGRAGEWLGALDLPGPAVAYVSSAARAAGTWEQLAPGLAALEPEVEIRDDLYLAGLDEVLEVLATTDDAVATVLVVGHNPTMTSLALSVAGQDAGDRLTRQGLPTSGVAVLAVPSWGDVEGRLLRFVTPRDI